MIVKYIKINKYNVLYEKQNSCDLPPKMSTLLIKTRPTLNRPTLQFPYVNMITY